MHQLQNPSTQHPPSAAVAAAAANTPSKKNVPTPPPQPTNPSNVVLGKNAVTPEVEAAMADFVKTTMEKGVAGLRKEFAQLKLYTSPQYKFEAFSNPNNALRNRYKDVVCLDSSRVILDLNVPPESDYIHANNVKLEGLDRSYIATQGPLGMFFLMFL
uniref:Tyrosine-protein phosphatase domain-containing protein n=1 Tax=Panagrolaimus davidi TaxID=227884 RepID=A0A914NYK0_9BILA